MDAPQNSRADDVVAASLSGVLAALGVPRSARVIVRDDEQMRDWFTERVVALWALNDARMMLARAEADVADLGLVADEPF